MVILAILLGAVGIVAGGWAYHLEQQEDKDEEVVINRLDATVQSNAAILAVLLEQQAKGPRHTACDTVQILKDLRADGLKLPRYPVEDRCQQ